MPSVTNDFIIVDKYVWILHLISLMYLQQRPPRTQTSESEEKVPRCVFKAARAKIIDFLQRHVWWKINILPFPPVRKNAEPELVFKVLHDLALIFRLEARQKIMETLISPCWTRRVLAIVRGLSERVIFPDGAATVEMNFRFCALVQLL